MLSETAKTPGFFYFTPGEVKCCIGVSPTLMPELAGLHIVRSDGISTSFNLARLLLISYKRCWAARSRAKAAASISFALWKKQPVTFSNSGDQCYCFANSYWFFLCCTTIMLSICKYVQYDPVHATRRDQALCAGSKSPLQDRSLCSLPPIWEAGK